MKILNPEQTNFLALFAKEKISNLFYLTGGTALCEFYIPYRYSEDLDFFSADEIKTDEIIVFLKKTKDKIGYDKFEYNTSFNRNLFFLKFSSSELKLEFTYYPFPQIHQPMVKGGLKIDSIEDIAVNKLFTIYQKPRSRDFMDLYIIIKKYKYSIGDLIKDAKIKFDTHIDLLKLGSQFLQAKNLKDFPRVIESLDEKLWQVFFEDEAKKLGKEIIS